MSNRPGVRQQRRRPRKRPKAHHLACLGMRHGSSTLSRIMEELGEDSPRLVVDSPTTLRGHLGHHHQHLAQGVLVW